MRIAHSLLLLVIALWLTGCTMQPRVAALFNGRDLAGWQGLVDPPKRAAMTPEELARAQAVADERMRAHWSVRDGVLYFDGEGDNLCTIRDYEDFVLTLEWKIPPGGDSGVYLRGCPQVQIWDNPIGSGGLFNNQRGPSTPALVADRPVGQWNTLRIQLIGDTVSVWLNSQLVVNEVRLENYWARTERIPSRGPIELQAHGGPLWFRNILIEELKITSLPGRPDAASASAR